MSISKVGTYAFYNHPNLERAVVSAPVIEANAFQGATKLEVVDLTSEAADTINASAFSGCSNLTHLVVRSTARSSLSATSALDGTKIKLGDGGVYVPADLLDSYKSATNWSAFAANIYPLSEYPRANFDTISDDWSTILTNPDYASAYAVKDTKTLEFTDGTKIKMMLVAKDMDNKTDRTGKAKMTWLSAGILRIPIRAYKANTYDGGWANWDVREYLNTILLNSIPNEIRNHIVSVSKQGTTYWPNKTKTIITTEDNVWVPSYSEVALKDWDTFISNDGVVYSDVFSTSSTRIRYSFDTGAASTWLLRNQGTSTYNYLYSRAVNSNGSDTNESYNQPTTDVVFGFCTD